MTLRTKLLLAQLPLLLAVLAVGLLGVGTIANLSQRSERIAKENYSSLRAAYEMNSALERLHDAAATALLSGHYTTPEHFSEFKLAFEKGLHQQRESSVEAGELEATSEVQRAWTDYLDALQALERAGQGVQSREIYFHQLMPSLSRVQKFVDHIVTINQSAMIQKGEHASARAMDFRTTALAVSLGALLVGLLVSLAITSRLLQPMAMLGRAVQRIGGGDFEARVSVGGRDEVTRLAGEINLMAHRLRQYRQSSLSELLLAQQASQAAIDSLPDPVLVFDLAGKIRHFNHESLNLVVPEPLGQTPLGWRVRDPGLEAHLAPLLQQVISGQGPHHPSGFEEAIKLDFGDGDRYLLPRATPVRDAADSVKGVTVVLQDVTRLRLFDQLKSDMVATVAHEFRTPLTSLRMAIYLLLEQVPGPLADKQRELLEAARNDCERVQAMVDDLLDLSRISDQGVQLRRQPVPAGEMIAYALEQHRLAADNKGLRLIAPGIDCQALVLADQDRVNLVFSNLLANAIRHTPAGGEVRLFAQSEGGWVRFEVSDSGEGIPVEHQEAIFRKFHGVPGAKPKGSGLGLFIARQAVRSHGGELGVESRPGQGSRFWFTLPQATA
ncbi:MAG: HAMP domain-containing protein [Desulfarculus sp.]|nr:HAMP domain-containing protein [Desulfarculus sp.]